MKFRESLLIDDGKAVINFRETELHERRGQMTNRHIRTLWLISIIVLLSGWSLAAKAQSKTDALPEWREFVSEAGGFSVKFPGTPVTGRATIEKGPLTINRFTHSLELGKGLSFEADYMDTPAGYDDSDLSLEGGISGLIRSMTAKGATLLSKDKIVRGTCEGREATLLLHPPGSPKTGFGQGRIFNSGQRYYFMVFVGSEDSPAVREMGRTFFESFTIKGGCSKLVAPVEATAPKTTREEFRGVVDPTTGWVKVNDENLGINVLMPAVVSHDIDQSQVKPFPLTHHTFINSRDGNVYSAEVISEYPPGFHSGQTSYLTIMDLTVYALKKNMEPIGFVFTPLRDLRVRQYPGREFAIASERLASAGRAQVYVTPKRVYIFIAFAHDQGVTLKLLDRFFGSIRIQP
jgi:hypothetical protein